MFRRRKHRGLLHRVRGFIWPHIGWRRAAAYFAHRVRRLPGSPRTIAAGLACGAAISFTPFIGFHVVLAALLAWTIGGNVVAAAFGTVVGNFLTFPFIWFGSYWLGCQMLGWEVGHALPESISITYIFAHPFVIYDYPFALLVPISVGGIAAGAVAWLAVYWSALGVVAEYQQLRRRRRAAGIERVRKTRELVASDRKEGRA